AEYNVNLDAEALFSALTVERQRESERLVVDSFTDEEITTFTHAIISDERLAKTTANRQIWRKHELALKVGKPTTEHTTDRINSDSSVSPRAPKVVSVTEEETDVVSTPVLPDFTAPKWLKLRE